MLNCIVDQNYTFFYLFMSILNIYYIVFLTIGTFILRLDPKRFLSLTRMRYAQWSQSHCPAGNGAGNQSSVT